jgi:uncharacterized protein (TIGR03382 family)
VKALALTGLLASTAASAFCPSYTLSSSSNTHNCGVEAAAGTNPTVAQWQSIFALVATGPAGWGTSGPTVPNINSGCGKPMTPVSGPPRFPCELLKAIAMNESSWKQFCVPQSPTDQIGGAERTIIAFDCGYGIGQVTSGMHGGESPAFDRARVASDATYNLATGTQILAGKWKATACVGDNQPKIIEDWYAATWAYNGLAYSNNPSNPAFSSTRGIWNPTVGGSVPYQERVFGWMEHPPTAAHWSVTAVAYPNPMLVGSAGAPPALPEPSCSTPTNCANTRAVHVSSCFGADAGTSDAGLADAGVADAGSWDAGVPDAGHVADSGVPDAGPLDSGSVDAGSPQNVDAGPAPVDAGPALPVVLESVSQALGPVPAGCGCSASSTAPFVSLLALALRRRRAR